MPRSLSAAFKAAAFAPQSGETAVALLELSHPTFADIIRVCTNNAPVVRLGSTYLPFPFDVTMPDEHDDGPPRVTLRISNVDRSIIAELRAIDPRSDPVTARLYIVLASQPDVTEVGPLEFSLRNTEADAASIEGTLQYEDLLNDQYPADAFTPAWFAALG